MNQTYLVLENIISDCILVLSCVCLQQLQLHADRSNLHVWYVCSVLIPLMSAFWLLLPLSSLSKRKHTLTDISSCEAILTVTDGACDISLFIFDRAGTEEAKPTGTSHPLIRIVSPSDLLQSWIKPQTFPTECGVPLWQYATSWCLSLSVFLMLEWKNKTNIQAFNSAGSYTNRGMLSLYCCLSYYRSAKNPLKLMLVCNTKPSSLDLYGPIKMHHTL